MSRETVDDGAGSQLVPERVGILMASGLCAVRSHLVVECAENEVW